MKKVSRIVGLCSKPLQRRCLVATGPERAALLEVVEQERPSVVPASDLRQHMENALHEIEQVSRAPQTLFHHYYICPCSTRGFAAAQGIASLQRVRRDVEASDRLAPTVKTQVRTGSLMPEALNSKQPSPPSHLSRCCGTSIK